MITRAGLAVARAMPRVASAVRYLAAGARDLAFPPACVFCRAPLLHGEGDADRLAICSACWPLLPVVGDNVCLRCGTPQGPHVGRVDHCNRCPTDFGGVRATVAVGRYVARHPDPARGELALAGRDDREAEEITGTPRNEESGDDLPVADDESDGTDDTKAEADAEAEAEAADLLDDGELDDELQAGPTMLRDAILRLKHHGGLDVAPALGKLLAGEVAAREWAPELHGVVPVPLHWRRVMERGFNQAEEIGRGVAGRLGLPLLPLLQRTRYTANQTSLPRLSRRSNVADAFALAGPLDRAFSWWLLRRHPDCSPLPVFLLPPDTTDGRTSDQPRPLAGRHLLLVDDVMTTGSTMAACARLLRRAGAARVYVAVVARV